MTDEKYSSIKVRKNFRNELKVFAAWKGQSIMDFVEEACRAQMPREPLLPFGSRQDENPPASP